MSSRQFMFFLIACFSFIYTPVTLALSFTANDIIDAADVGASGADLQGLQWLSLSVTRPVSHNAAVGDTNLTSAGWRIATRVETETLITSLWGGIASEGASNSNYAGANWFVNAFGGVLNSHAAYTNFLESMFTFGDRGECTTSGQNVCLGSVSTFDNLSFNQMGVDAATRTFITTYSANSGRAGIFGEFLGLNAGFSNSNSVTSDSDSRASSGIGALMVRVAPPKPNPVTTPPMIWLVASGLLGLIGFSRKQNRTVK